MRRDMTRICSIDCIMVAVSIAWSFGRVGREAWPDYSEITDRVGLCAHVGLSSPGQDSTKTTNKSMLSIPMCPEQ